MNQNNADFREELAWNSYFVDEFYKRVNEEVELVAKQYEEESGTEISEDLDDIVEEIVDGGLHSLIENS